MSEHTTPEVALNYNSDTYIVGHDLKHNVSVMSQIKEDSTYHSLSINSLVETGLEPQRSRMTLNYAAKILYICSCVKNTLRLR